MSRWQVRERRQSVSTTRSSPANPSINGVTEFSLPPTKQQGYTTAVRLVQALFPTSSHHHHHHQQHHKFPLLFILMFNHFISTTFQESPNGIQAASDRAEAAP